MGWPAVLGWGSLLPSAGIPLTQSHSICCLKPFILFSRHLASLFQIPFLCKKKSLRLQERGQSDEAESSEPGTIWDTEIIRLWTGLEEVARVKAVE